MSHVAIPKQVWESAMHLLGTLPAGQSRATMNAMEGQGREITLPEPQPVDVDGAIVTQEEREALLKESGE